MSYVTVAAHSLAPSTTSLSGEERARTITAGNHTWSSRIARYTRKTDSAKRRVMCILLRREHARWNRNDKPCHSCIRLRIPGGEVTASQENGAADLRRSGGGIHNNGRELPVLSVACCYIWDLFELKFRLFSRNSWLIWYIVLFCICIPEINGTWTGCRTLIYDWSFIVENTCD